MFHRCPLYIPLFCFWIHGTRFTYIVVTLTHCQYLSIISCILNQFFIVVTGVVQAWSCYANGPYRMRWRRLVTKCFWHLPVILFLRSFQYCAVVFPSLFFCWYFVSGLEFLFPAILCRLELFILLVILVLM
jgi:hypothetical protein